MTKAVCVHGKIGWEEEVYNFIERTELRIASANLLLVHYNLKFTAGPFGGAAFPDCGGLRKLLPNVHFSGFNVRRYVLGRSFTQQLTFMFAPLITIY